MKNIISFYRRMFGLLRVLFFTGLFLSVFISCNSDDVSEKNLYTFVGETVYSYCKVRPEFSVFTKLMEDTGSDKLLSVYGHYTCFIPADTAFRTYFHANNLNYDSLSVSQKRSLLYNHLVSDKTAEYDSESFEEGALPTSNMNNNSVVVSFHYAGDTTVHVCGSRVLIKDQEVHNGIVHVVGKVVESSSLFLLDILKQHGGFALFSEALEKTRLADSTHRIVDESYVYRKLEEWYDNPKCRKYGYTLFAETDGVFHQAGIQTLSDLTTFAEKYYGTKDRNNPTSCNNALNKFVSYHLLERKIPTNLLVYTGICTVKEYADRQYEHYETFLKYRMFQVTSGNRINVRSDGSYVSIDEYGSNLLGVNGYVHTLKNLLVYDEEAMQGDVLNKRIRFDLEMVAPEATTNSLRTSSGSYFAFPEGYLGDCVQVRNGYTLLCVNNTWGNHQGTEFRFCGAFDATMRLLPVPPGTYEVRLGYPAWYDRGIVQLFFDNRIVGIPLDMSRFGGEEIGWVADSETEDEGVSADKVMRNLGYMKAPCSIVGGSSTTRDEPNKLRIILGTFVFQDYAYHAFRIKNVENPNLIFSGDYIEYVPKNYLSKEGKD